MDSVPYLHLSERQPQSDNSVSRQPEQQSHNNQSLQFSNEQQPPENEDTVKSQLSSHHVNHSTVYRLDHHHESDNNSCIGSDISKHPIRPNNFINESISPFPFSCRSLFSQEHSHPKSPTVRIPALTFPLPPTSSFPNSCTPTQQLNSYYFHDSSPDSPFSNINHDDIDKPYHNNLSTELITTNRPTLLGSVVFLGFLNIFLDTALSSSVIPILPRELHQDEFHEALIIGCGAVTATLFGNLYFFVTLLIRFVSSGPICGWLSDSYGWGIILAGFYPLVFSSALLMLSATNQSFNRFLIARFIAGAGSGFMYPSNLSMVVATHHSKIRSSAVGLTLAGDIGSLISPIMSGYLYDTGGLVLVYSVLLCLSVVAALVFLIVFPSVSASSWDCFKIFRSSSSSLPRRSSLSEPFLVLQPLHLSPSHSPLCYTQESCDHPKFQSSSRPSVTSTCCADSDGPSIGLTSSPSLQSSSFSLPVFSHGSPPPPYLYNLHLKKPPSLYQENLTPAIPTLDDSAILQRTWASKCISVINNLKMFFTVSFMSRCISLFYCWGLAISLQSILPIIWDRRFDVGPTQIGILFAPHLILRVAVSAFFPYFSDVTATPLRSLISLGLFVCTASTAVLALLPISSPPLIHSIVVGFVGLGLGLTDSCAIAWGGGAIFLNPDPSLAECNNPDVSSSSSLPSPPIAECNNPDSSESYRGRAFALLAFACDLGMFTVPLVASFLSEYFSFSIAFGVLSFSGLVVLGMSIFCEWIESSAEQAAL